jgi:hypothetical protein
MWHRGGERAETTPVRLMRILLGKKIKKIHVVDSVRGGAKGWATAHPEFAEKCHF